MTDKNSKIARDYFAVCGLGWLSDPKNQKDAIRILADEVRNAQAAAFKKAAKLVEANAGAFRDVETCKTFVGMVLDLAHKGA